MIPRWYQQENSIKRGREDNKEKSDKWWSGPQALRDN
jgi:hypothetical protein